MTKPTTTRTCATLGVCQSPATPCPTCAAAALIIPRTSHNQTDMSLAVLNFVARTGPCSKDQLYAHFANFQGQEVSRRTFSLHLTRQRTYGKLQTRGMGAELVWELGPMAIGQSVDTPRKSGKANKAAASAQDEEAEEPLPRYVGAIVPPRQVDVMHSPVYVPKPGPSLRPGAMDFKNCGSRGHAC